MVYQWKEAARIKTDANIAGKVCEELAETVGLTAESLLNASRAENAPLHGEFEWNDAIAAEEHRKNQARYIIRMLCIKKEPEKDENGEEEVIPLRAFFKADVEVFEPIKEIMCEAKKRTALLDTALRELTAVQNKYIMLSELKPVFEAIEKVKEEF